MPDKKTYSIDVGGKPLTLEFSNLAGQTNGSVIAKYGGTAVLATAVMTERDANLDYLPLRVDYEERFYAAGKIIGSRYVRRESRPSEEAILAGRLVDRTIRPLFDHGIRRDIQVVVTVVAYDEENDPDFLGLIAGSVALSVSDIPWDGPASGVRIAKTHEKFVVNPGIPDLAKPETKFEIFASGPKGLVNMIELAGLEATHEEILEALALAEKENAKLIDFQSGIVREIGKKKTEVKRFEVDPALRKVIEEYLDEHLEAVMYGATPPSYHERIKDLWEGLHAHVEEKSPGADAAHISHVVDDVMDRVVRRNILESERRPDGRKLNEVRALSGETGLFSRTHGSAVFMRGNTHALAVTTLAAPGAEQLIETMETTGKRHFMLHYNFPPYSVGEIGSFRGPGRREIGHGNLARNAIEPLLPLKVDFPYTIRVVSEILSSNGSSSMATTCACCLSLMDAGVPLKKHAAGTAMGIIIGDDGTYKILTDIQGPEDHYGDMDFKAAGTDAGVNAIQLDTKVKGVTLEMIKATLEQAREARLHIIEFMKSVIAEPRATLSPFVPKIITIVIDPKKIGMVIGPGGKTINGMIEKYGLASIDIEEDGKVFVSAMDQAAADKAAEEIRGMTKEFTVGEIIEGNVIKIMDFGAIVDLGGGQDGMIHVSELKEGYVKKVEDVVKLGDFVRAKIVRVEDGKIGLSIKQVEK